MLMGSSRKVGKINNVGGSKREVLSRLEVGVQFTYRCFWGNPMDCSQAGSSIRKISWQEYWSGLPFSPPEDLLDPGIKLMSPASYTLAGRFFITEPPGRLV